LDIVLNQEEKWKSIIKTVQKTLPKEQPINKLLKTYKKKLITTPPPYHTPPITRQTPHFSFKSFHYDPLMNLF
jgi:hypothetical protein